MPFQSKQCQERPFSHKDWQLAIAAGTDWMLTLCWALSPEHYMQMAESPQHHQAGRAIHVPSHRWGRKLGLSQVTEGLCSRSPAEHGLGLGSEPRQSDSHQEWDWSECHPSPPSQTLQSSASTFSPPALLFPTLLHPSTFKVAAMPLDNEVSPCLITTPPQTTHAVTWT